MKEQKVLIILKPDCIRRKLEEDILAMIERTGLLVIRRESRVLETNEIISLYQEYAKTSTFQDLVRYMSSGPSMILLLSGLDAVSIMIKLKGRTGSGKGIRGMYAENFIQNIIHSPETALKASREISIFFPSEVIPMQENKVIFGLSGMTECGKSTAGIFFAAHGVKRLKIIQILDLVRQENDPGNDTITFINAALKDRSEWLRLTFADKLLEEMHRLGIRYCSLESMGDPEMVRYLRSRFPGEFFSIFIDASLEKRLRHQMIRENLTDIAGAKKILCPKDDFKVSFWKMPDIKAIADVVIDNNGTLEVFKEQLNALLVEHRIA